MQHMYLGGERGVVRVQTVTVVYVTVINQASMCSSDELQSIQEIQFQSEPVPIPTLLCKTYSLFLAKQRGS